MNEIQLRRLDLNLLIAFKVLVEEQSVMHAAERLGRTPSAVSHALGRLRQQLDDPLLVKVGGKMNPSPRALLLYEDIVPILRDIERVVQPPKPFDPTTTTRTFRLAVPAVSALTTEVTARVHQAAPNVSLDWRPPSLDTYHQVVDEEIDIAMHVANQALPDGVAEQLLPPLPRFVFARSGHPALADWSLEAWLKWPHVMVGIPNSPRGGVGDSIVRIGHERRIGARVQLHADIPPILAGTDMLANQIVLALLNDIDRYGLKILMPPVQLPDLTFRLFWNARMASDPGNCWIRTIVSESFETVVNEAERKLSVAEVIETWTSRV